MTGSEITAYSTIAASAMPISAFIAHETGLLHLAGLLGGQIAAAVVTVVALHRIDAAVMAHRATRNRTGGAR